MATYVCSQCGYLVWSGAAHPCGGLLSYNQRCRDLEAALVAASESVEALGRDNVLLGARVLQLEAALRAIPCPNPDCHDGGKLVAWKYGAPRKTCPDCAGTGLHPTARRVLEGK